MNDTADLGLHKQRVELVAHRETWRASFVRHRQRIALALGERVARIEHIGSTSVPGLAAKPVIDIAVLVHADTHFFDIITDLCSAGYYYRGDKGSNGGLLFVHESAAKVRTHHLHVVRPGDPAFARYLLFRDALRAESTLRSAYAQLKHRLAEQFPNQREAYTAAKADFIAGVLTANQGDLADKA